ncbi:TPA: hypothetical protein N0F65_009803 [Lagenidium giganteum]|uniref:S-adenosyl-L-methionine-dependent methyltransferase n=1 Tax=Lagenidium giganteum TaxID=4803 RepID=A0AAV2YJU1_9STRA|nr:TPA: hypothetical protein N0F65_009803 [Lagenidium giganteum]
MFEQCRAKHEDLANLNDKSFPLYTAMLTAHLRALEATRPDAVVVDPFAEALAGDAGKQILALMNQGSTRRNPSDLLALRTRYLDEALTQRDPSIQQIVILAAGLDTRAYRLDALKGCHVLEVDMCRDVIERKQRIMRECNAPLKAKKLDHIITDLTDDCWQSRLIKHGFDPKVPTFWCMEGLLYYLTREPIVKLIKTIDALSAPKSTLWFDMCGQAFVNGRAGSAVNMRYGEDDPLSGVLGVIGWRLEADATLGEAGRLFGREWKPLTVRDTNEPIPWYFVRGVKPY